MGRPYATETRKKIYNLAVKGLSDSQIADKLFMQHGGVRANITKIYFSHQVSNRAQLIAKHYMGERAFRAEIESSKAA